MKEGALAMEKMMAWIMAMALALPGIAGGFTYESQDRLVEGRPQQVHVLEASLGEGEVRLEQALSLDLFYGTETTSAMARRHGADAAVNGMFYNALGRPAGLLAMDGRLVSSTDIGTPSVLVGTRGETAIRQVSASLEVSIGRMRLLLDGVNQAVHSGEAVLFTGEYGRTTRIRRSSINYCVAGGKLAAVVRTDQPVALEGYDYVVSMVDRELGETVPLGTACFLRTDFIGAPFAVEEAFQTGGWLLKDGEAAAGGHLAYMGPASALAPRTLVGVKADGALVFMVVDGRRPGTSEGITGRQAARLMQDAGCVDAAFLDGGASSTMVIGGRVANRPSGQEERAVAHSILLTRVE